MLEVWADSLLKLNFKENQHSSHLHSQYLHRRKKRLDKNSHPLAPSSHPTAITKAQPLHKSLKRRNKQRWETSKRSVNAKKKNQRWKSFVSYASRPKRPKPCAYSSNRDSHKRVKAGWPPNAKNSNIKNRGPPIMVLIRIECLRRIAKKRMIWMMTLGDQCREVSKISQSPRQRLTQSSIV